MRARTKDSNGQELGTFTADTRPTSVQAEEIIARAVDDVESELGSDLDSQVLMDQAKTIVIYRAAMLVETTFFPTKLRTDRTPAKFYKDLYDEKMKQIKLDISSEASGDLPGPEDALPMPSYNYGEDERVGMDTPF